MGLQNRGVKAAQPVAIMLPTSDSFFYSFFGILLAGGIPVPVYPPARPAQIEDHMLRHKGILNNCQASLLITTAAAKRVAQLLKSLVSSLRHIVDVDELMSQAGNLVRPNIEQNHIAFLQYTSGSTGNPKGVVLTHANLVANIRAMGKRVQATPNDVFISWLPLYHDMGLIGAWLGSLYYGALCVVMSPLAFITRPQRWLWAIHRYNGTLAASPNFGYELCLGRIQDQDIQGLDLSSWRFAFNGAETINPNTAQDFVKRFQRFGFPSQSMAPVYGLAESSVGLAFPEPDRGLVIDRIKRFPFMQEGIAIPADESDEHVLSFVACGMPLDQHQIRIVDAFDNELPERQQGRLQFCGPSVTSGYYRNTQATQRLYHGDWLDSADLAYICRGEVYITGRVKDIIIRAGQNLYPHELEDSIGDIDGIRKGRVAVFGSKNEVMGTEKLVVLAETRETDRQLLERLNKQINTLALDLVGSPPDEVVLAPPNSVLKTSSGKIRRAASRELYEQGKIGHVQKAVWLQVCNLVLRAMLVQMKRVLPIMKRTTFALYGKTIFWLLAPLTWILIAILPKPSWRWAVMRTATRALARLTATPIITQGFEYLPPVNHPCVFVVNHASYLDGPLIVATLDRPFSFVAKLELAKEFIAGTFLKRINTEFVERFEAKQSVADAQHLVDVVRSGRQLVFFPEGTFTRIPGLRPFHMGAFMAAAQADVPIVPIVIRGMRSILRAESTMPFRGQITITICPPIEPDRISSAPTADIWDRAIALRDAAREQILRFSGESDLSG